MENKLNTRFYKKEDLKNLKGTDLLLGAIIVDVIKTIPKEEAEEKGIDPDAMKLILAQVEDKEGNYFLYSVYLSNKDKKNYEWQIDYKE